MLAGDNSVVLTLPLVVGETLTPVSTRTTAGHGKLVSSPGHLYQVIVMVLVIEIDMFMVELSN